jgi:hypothetical protein
MVYSFVSVTVEVLYGVSEVIGAVLVSVIEPTMVY